MIVQPCYSSRSLFQLILSLLGLWCVTSLAVGMAAEANQTARKQANRRPASVRGLGYLGVSSQPSLGQLGVTRHKGDLAQPGVNFYCGGDGPTARLIDMEGNVLHRWQLAWSEAFRSSPGPEDKPFLDPEKTKFWRKCRLLEDGSIIAVFEGLGIVRIGKDSSVIWAKTLRAHHDITIENGKIFVLSRRIRNLQTPDQSVDIAEDFITVLSKSGETLQSISILDAIVNSDYTSLLYRTDAGIWQTTSNPRLSGRDPLHPNALQILRPGHAFLQKIGRSSGAYALLTFRVNDSIALLSLQDGKIVWTLSNLFQAPHHGRAQPDGELMVFDNWGRHDLEPMPRNKLYWADNRSRLLKFDPVTQKISWRYPKNAETEFYSHCCGLYQPLENGNYLIVESTRARAFEVTPEGKLVWEFRNPHPSAKNQAKTGSIYHLERLSREAVDAWLNPSD